MAGDGRRWRAALTAPAQARAPTPATLPTGSSTSHAVSHGISSQLADSKGYDTFKHWRQGEEGKDASAEAAAGSVPAAAGATDGARPPLAPHAGAASGVGK